ncbi:hypothetical protein G6F59_018727 [Rhizopus arrhizus]|nr:hypothetical protein G6F59_018727 [Rhizopus arrhizus]
MTTFSTPGGMPACSPSQASASAVNGVNSEGLSTTVQPAASAGRTLRVTSADEKFHAMMAAHTPTGWRMASMRWSLRVCGSTSP